jgi:mannitol-1-phosphate 5-dehydrogenase
VFEEKEGLLPFEEAKLYGHNATHALAAYLGALKGVRTIAELGQLSGVLEFLRAAFLNESGETLIRKYRGIDALFTGEGYEEYADDLLKRMLNPYLGDTVERVGRDPLRKLSWDDRLVGTVREALQQGVEPRRFAAGVAAALATLEPSFLLTDAPAIDRLKQLWADASPVESEAERLITLVLRSARLLRLWLRSEATDLEHFFCGIGAFWGHP